MNYRHIPTNIILSIIVASGLIFCGCSGHSAHEGTGHEHELDGHSHDGEDHDDHDHEAENHDHSEGGHGHEGHDGEIPLPDKEAASLGVKTSRVSPGLFAESLRVGGEVERAMDGEYIVSAPRSGRFTASKGLQTGARISAGQSLGTISSAGIEGGDNVSASRARLAAAEREVERLKPLAETGAVSRSELQRAEADLAAARAESGAPVSSAAVSPGSGVVTSVMTRNGEYVERGQAIAVVSRNTSLTLRADVPARHAAAARRASTANFRQEGMSKAVSLRDNGGHRLGGETASAVSGYIPVRFSFSNDGTAVPGAYAEVWLTGPERQDVITVPISAIVEINGVKYVFQKVHEGKYAKRRVETGGSDGISYEVLSGLSGGEEIVTDGARVIRMAEISNIAPPAHTHNH